eukprot:jgi/Tetstr1/423138/TSEL_013907.t1
MPPSAAACGGSCTRAAHWHRRLGRAVVAARPCALPAPKRAAASRIRFPARRASVVVAAESAGKKAGQPPPAKQPSPREPLAQRALTALLNTTNIPCGSYVAEPRTVLHGVDARVKQLWLLSLMCCLARSTVPVRLAATLLVAAMTVFLLPRRTWAAQLKPLLLLCALLFVGTLLGADGVPPVVSMRTHAMDGLALGEGLAPDYSYVLGQLGPLTITRKSLNLAISAVCLTFSVIQAAALTLLTTTEESMALGLGWFLAPLRVLGVPVRQLVFSLLLSLRFMSLVFEEVRHLALGLAARNINWAQLGFMGSVDLVVALAGKLLRNLFAHAEKIAAAMHARGFEGVEAHTIHRTDTRGANLLLSGLAVGLLAAWLPGCLWAAV